MKNMKIVTSLIIISTFEFIALASLAFASSGTEWGYSGGKGPEHWGSLSSEYSACAIGLNQSPVNLTAFVEAELDPLDLNYGTPAMEILNNGHTVQINYAPGSTLKIDGKEFALKQVHFHTPSENMIEGKSFPMEGHLVHAAPDGQLAVIGVMYVEGKNNNAVAEAWSVMPTITGEHKTFAGSGSAEEMLPDTRDYYRFNGSLTTPPCTEGVRWLMLKQPAEISSEQIRKFSQAIKTPNNRPVQPLNARVVLQ